jgi:hypothetical protein
MSRRVHFELEILYGTLCQPLCENQSGRDAIADANRSVEMSVDPAEVTCRSCLAALGYEATAPDQLTDCQPDPLRRAA